MNMNSVSALGADANSSCYKTIQQESLPALCFYDYICVDTVDMVEGVCNGF